MEKQLVDETYLSKLLNISKRTLQKWRGLGRGPPWIKVGSAVRYDLAAVEAWIDSRRRTEKQEDDEANTEPATWTRRKR